MKRGSSELKRHILLLFSALTLFALAVGAFAIPQNVTTNEMTMGANETRSNGPAGAFISGGGNITELNITNEKQSGWWMGVWGSLRLNFTLEDASGNVFYNWGLADPAIGEVYFKNDSVLSWVASDITVAGVQNATYAQDVLGWADSGNIDNLTNTYDFNTSGHYHQAFSITGGGTFAQNTTSAVNLLTSDGRSFNATMLWQQNSLGVRYDQPLFAALVQNDLPSFKGTGLVADFEVLLPTRADGGTETYFLYAELS